jgi:hypothetical protein
MAEKYSIYVVNVDKSAREIVQPRDAPVLQLDADVIAAGSVPNLGYLPFELAISLPQDPSGECVPFVFRDVAIDLTLNHHRPRDPSRVYSPLTFSINGCSRDIQTVRNLTFHAVGFSNLQLSFLTLADSHDVMAIEAPAKSVANLPAPALLFSECDVRNCTLAYFGDVEGGFGDAEGRTQYGTRSLGSSFRVADPHAHIPDYSFRAEADGSYSFAWYGTFHNSSRAWVHLCDSNIQLIRDASLGSVNVSRCNFSYWTSPASPVFAEVAVPSNPPCISVCAPPSATAGLHTHTHTRACSPTHACARAHTHTRAHERTHACMHARTHACTYAHAHARTNTITH